MSGRPFMGVQFGDLPPDQQAAWYDVLGQFQQKEAAFNAAYADLSSRGAWVATQDAKTQADYAAMMQKANDTRDTVAKIHAGLDDITSAVSGAWGSVTGAAESLWGSIKGSAQAIQAQGTVDQPPAISEPGPLYGLGNLGILPVLIPIAAIAASIAVVSYFLNDYAQFTKRLDTMQQLQSQGVPADQAAAILNKVAPLPTSIGAGVGGAVMNLGLIALIGFGLWYFWKQKRG